MDGCYHGAHDSLSWSAAGSGVATLAIPGSPGVPELRPPRRRWWCPFNDLEAAASRVRKSTPTTIAGRHHSSPSRATWAASPPSTATSQGLVDPCAPSTARCSIFDEVMTGFRVAPRQRPGSCYGVTPDLTTAWARSWAVGSRWPHSAGRADIMDHLAPKGPVYQAGTLSGNPVAVAAGHRHARRCLDDAAYDALEEFAGNRIEQALQDAARVPRLQLLARRVDVHASSSSEHGTQELRRSRSQCDLGCLQRASSPAALSRRRLPGRASQFEAAFFELTRCTGRALRDGVRKDWPRRWSQQPADPTAQPAAPTAARDRCGFDVALISPMTRVLVARALQVEIHPEGPLHCVDAYAPRHHDHVPRLHPRMCRHAPDSCP